jgi:hypothetical protein
VSTQRTTIQEAQARSDGLRLLKAINDTQAHGQQGTRADSSRATHKRVWIWALRVTKMR